MLEARVKQLQKQACEDFRYNESLKARLVPFLRKEAGEKEATEKEAAEKVSAKMEDDNDEEDQQAWPSRSSDDDDPVSPIRFPRVKHWFKCPICLKHLYQHKNSFFGHIKNFIMEELSTLDVVEQHHQLNKLLEETLSDLSGS
jgi:hypothetical protein